MAFSASRSPLRHELFNMKRDRILAEAATLFYEQGYLPTTVSDIAKRLGTLSGVELAGFVAAHQSFGQHHRDARVGVDGQVRAVVLERPGGDQADAVLLRGPVD